MPRPFFKFPIKKPILKLKIAFAIAGLFVALPLHSQLPSQFKAEDKSYREYMLTITRQLGVTCNSCHNPANFASAEKLDFKIAKEHIKLTQLILDNGFDGQNGHPKADCYMCHRGKLKPDYHEPFDTMTMQKAKPNEKKSTNPEPTGDAE